eukprot:COSAG05_NODE_22773_length_262_cov_0.944785_1_plen_28_part_01
MGKHTLMIWVCVRVVVASPHRASLGGDN